MADRTVRYVLTASITDLQAKMAQAGASVGAAADRMTAANAEGVKFRQGLDQLGGTAGKVGLVAAAGLGVAIKTAADFDQSMSSVQAATMETASNMDLLREAAIQAGADTAFSATEAAAGIENLAKAGVSTADILDGGLTGALDLAAAGELGVADAAEIAATALTQFNLAGEDVPHVADLLAAGAGKAQGDVTDLAMALKQSGLVAAQMGISIEETTGTLSAFASAGLLGSDAGTSFRTMLLRLANPTKESAQLMEELGINAYDANGNLVSMADLSGQLQSAFTGQTQAQRDAAMATLFGSDAIRAANVLYNQGSEGIQEWTNKVDDSGYAAETAATRLDNLKGDLEALSGSLETALIGTGSGSQGPLRSLVQNLTDVVNAYNDLPPAAQNATAQIMGAGAALGGSVWVGSKLIQGIANTREALMNVGMTAERTKGLLAGVGKGVTFAAVIIGLSQLDNALDDLLNTSFEGSNLDRSLEALSKGRVEGTIFETYGKDLEGFVTNLDLVNSKAAQASGAIMKILPGDAPIDDARENLRQLDEMLAGMVEGGDIDTAASAFERLTDAAVEQGYSVDQVREQFEQYRIAVANAEGSGSWASSVGSALRGMVPDAQAATRALLEGGEGADVFRAAMERLNAVLDGRAGLRDYEAALDDFTKSLKDNGKTFDINTEKGRANQAALDNIASSALNVADGLKGAARQKFLTGAIQDIREFGKNAGVPQSETRALIQLLKQADSTNVNPDINADTSAADRSLNATKAKLEEINRERPRPIVTAIIAGVGAAEAALNNLARPRSATIYVQTKGSGAGPLAGNADGGSIPKDGGPYADRYPYLLAPGEEVISNRYGQADRHRDLLKAINAGRLADGGTVTAMRAASAVPATTGSGSVRVEVAGHMTGTMATPWGNVPFEGQVRQIARDEVTAAYELAEERGRANYGY